MRWKPIVQLDYFEATSSASVKLEWQSASQRRQFVPVELSYPPISGENRPPNRPLITSPSTEDESVNVAEFQFATEPFTDADGASTHLTTDWEIWNQAGNELVWTARNATGANRTRISLARGLFTNSLTSLGRLELNSRYRLRVRFQDSSGDPQTKWSDGAELGFNTFTPDYLVGPGAFWRYLDDGSNQGTNWFRFEFDDRAWKEARGSFGYGDLVGEGTFREATTTVLSYGSNANNRFITSYFRTTFGVDSASGMESLQLKVMRDDGICLYLNGVEIFRNNLPAGTLGYRSLAVTNAQGVDRYRLIAVSVPVGLLLSGRNVLAAELHQAAANDGDAAFYAEFTGLRRGVGSPSTLVDSDFESGNNEGWGIFQGPGLAYSPIGGNPGGHLAIYDPGNGRSFLWNAPAKYRTNLAGAYGGSIHFDAKASTVGRLSSMVVLNGSNIAIHATTPYIRRTTWLPFRIPLDESYGWRVGSVTNYADATNQASRAQILEVLSNVRQFRIWGEAFGVSDTAWLDNVRVVGPAIDDLAELRIEPAGDDRSALSWPANRPGLVLETSASLTDERWQSVVDTSRATVTNGLNYLAIDVGSSNRFSVFAGGLEGLECDLAYPTSPCAEWRCSVPRRFYFLVGP